MSKVNFAPTRSSFVLRRDSGAESDSTDVLSRLCIVRVQMILIDPELFRSVDIDHQVIVSASCDQVSVQHEQMLNVSVAVTFDGSRTLF